MLPFLHVAAAVLMGEDGWVLIARRPAHLHGGGLWEFPGGKLEPGERVEAGLARELEEELGLTPLRYRPLIRVHHHYPGRDILLDVWRVEAWSGEPQGREGQPIEWVPPGELVRRRFPEANLPVVSAARLPETYLITPEPGADDEEFLARLEQSLAAGVRLVQLRAPSITLPRFHRLARAALDRCRGAGAWLLLNAPPALLETVPADGVHLSAARLRACGKRPLPRERWVAASCHDPAELAHAHRIGVDFAVLSPVRRTPSHPGAGPLGWLGFWRAAERAVLPVYALGGLAPRDLLSAWAHGAQGVAAIRGLWAGA